MAFGYETHEPIINHLALAMYIYAVGIKSLSNWYGWNILSNWRVCSDTSIIFNTLLSLSPRLFLKWLLKNQIVEKFNENSFYKPVKWTMCGWVEVNGKPMPKFRFCKAFLCTQITTFNSTEFHPSLKQICLFLIICLKPCDPYHNGYSNVCVCFSISGNRFFAMNVFVFVFIRFGMYLLSCAQEIQ